MGGWGSLVKGGINMFKSGGKSAARATAKEGLTHNPSLMAKIAESGRNLVTSPMGQRVMLAGSSGLAASKMTGNQLESNYEERMAAQQMGYAQGQPGQQGWTQTVDQRATGQVPQGQQAQNQPQVNQYAHGQQDGDGAVVSAGGRESGFSDKGSLLKTMGAGAVGALTGAFLKSKNSESEGGSMGEIVKGALAGGTAGAFGKMAFDGIQAENGGFKAGASGAVANMAASLLNDDPDGPGLLGSAMTGFGSGSMGNLAHDKLTEHGKDGLGDAAAYGSLGFGLGKSTGVLGDVTDMVKTATGHGEDDNYIGAPGTGDGSGEHDNKDLPGQSTMAGIIGTLDDKLNGIGAPQATSGDGQDGPSL